MLTLTNSFHNSSCRTRLTREDMERIEQNYQCGDVSRNRAARKKISRIRRQLCGIPHCTCGQNVWGERK